MFIFLANRNKENNVDSFNFKNYEMIDYWFCTSECPLKKFKLIDKSEF